jgi:transposase InsO family protein
MGRIDRSNGQDAVMEKRHIQTMLRNIQGYELVKSKKHPTYKTATEFYDGAGVCKQNFLKYYRRFINANREIASLLPHKTGRKFREESPYLKEVIDKLKEIRAKGFNRYDLQIKLRKLLGVNIAPSTIYRLLRKLKINRLNPKIKEEKRKIIKMHAGEMGNIDIHYITKGTVKAVGDKKLYLLGLIDAYSRVCWVEVIDSIKAIDVMFATMEILMRLQDLYGIKFESIMSDNGVEFSSKNNPSHPFEKLLCFYSIKHIYTKPCRPQTNGKIERFWRTVEDEILGGEEFETLKELKEYVMGYVIYYNEQRIHQGIDNITPLEMLSKGTKDNNKNKSNKK